MIIKASLAGINSKVDTDNKHLIRKTELFRFDYRGEPQVIVKVTDLELRNFSSKYTGYSKDQAVMRLSAENFFSAAAEFGCFGIKAATVSIGDKNFIIAAKGEKDRNSFVSSVFSAGHGIKLIDDSVAAVVINGSGVFVYGTPWSSRTPLKEKNKLDGIIIPSDVISITPAGRKELIDRMLLCLILPKRAEQLSVIYSYIDGLNDAVPVLAVPENDSGAFYSYVTLGMNG